MKHEAISQTRHELRGENENQFFVLWSTFYILIMGKSEAKAGGTQPNVLCRYRGQSSINGARARPGKFGFGGGWNDKICLKISELWPTCRRDPHAHWARRKKSCYVQISRSARLKIWLASPGVLVLAEITYNGVGYLDENSSTLCVIGVAVGGHSFARCRR
jgi:hypothetical protein